MSADRKQIPWTEIVEFVRENHNGVMSVELFFGHDGHNVCRFCPYRPDAVLASGDSGRSMQEAVERCYYEWYLSHRSKIATNSGWQEFTRTLGIEA